MKKYLKTSLVFAGIWFTASVVNAVLSSISMLVLDSGGINNVVGSLGLSVIFSFVCSVPMVGLVWFITLMAQAADKKGNELLQLVLRTALFCSMGGSLIFIYTIGTAFKDARFVMGFCIIVSALTSVLLFRKQIKTNA